MHGELRTTRPCASPEYVRREYLRRSSDLFGVSDGRELVARMPKSAICAQDRRQMVDPARSQDFGKVLRTISLFYVSATWPPLLLNSANLAQTYFLPN